MIIFDQLLFELRRKNEDNFLRCVRSYGNWCNNRNFDDARIIQRTQCIASGFDDLGRNRVLGGVCHCKTVEKRCYERGLVRFLQVDLWRFFCIAYGA
jgi:hypothetical protein